MKLNYKRTLLVGLAFLSICTFWQAYDGIIPLILKNTFGIGETATGQIMAIDNMLALVMLPLFGHLSDKTHTPIGKRTPYIVFGTIVAVVSMLFLPHFDNTENLLGFALCLGLTLLAMATYRSPAVSLMPDVTPKKLRSKGNAVINLMGACGGILVLALGIVFGTGSVKNDLMSYVPFFIAVSGIMLLSLAFFMWKVKEPRLVAEKEAEEKRLGISDDGEEELGAAPSDKKGLSKGEKLTSQEKETLSKIRQSLASMKQEINKFTAQSAENISGFHHSR